MLKKCVFVFFTVIIGSIAQTPEASPEELTRRLFLDLFSRLPKEVEYEKTRKLIATGKYKDVVNSMLLNEEFRKVLADKIIDHYKPDMPQGFDLLRIPLRDYIVKNHTGPRSDFRKFLKDYLTAEGIQYSNPMTIFYASEEQAPDMAGRIAQRVVGLPYNCARCHDHKDYDKIKHKDFWEFASFFNSTVKNRVLQVRQVEVVAKRLENDKTHLEKSIGKDNVAKIAKWVQAEKQGKNVYLMDYGGGGMMQKRNNLSIAKVPQIFVLEKEIDMSRLRIRFKAEKEVQTAYAMLPTSSRPEKGTKKPRTVLADWVISRNNPYTAKAISSWMSHWLLGHSFILPMTDVYGGDGPKKAVLAQCANIFKQKNWSLTSLAAAILTSKFYKMKSASKNDEEAFVKFDKRRYRHLSGEQLINTIRQYTERKIHSEKLSKIIQFQREKQANEIKNKFFPTSLEDDDANYKGTLGQSLFMSNNDKILTFINMAAKDGHASDKSSKEWITTIIRSLFTREPTSQEIKFFGENLHKNNSYEDSGYFDVLWAIMNSPELRLY